MTTAIHISADPRAVIETISTRLDLITVALKTPKLSDKTIETVLLAIKHTHDDLNPVLQHLESTLGDVGRRHRGTITSACLEQCELCDVVRIH